MLGMFRIKKLTTEQFIQRARKINGEKYNYEKTEYDGMEKKVKIICKKHGIFEQNPGSHLKGNGCRKCGYESARLKNLRSER